MANPSTSPLNCDPMTVGYFQNANPAVSNRQKSTNWQGRAIAPLRLQPTTSASPPTSASRAATPTHGSSPPRCRKAGTVRVFSENIKNNRSDTVPILDFRVDKAFRIGRYRFTGMFDSFNVTNSNAGDEFHPDQRRQSTTRSSRRSTHACCSSASGSISDEVR